MKDVISVCPISDGHYVYPQPRELLFPGVDEESLKQAGIPVRGWEKWESPYTATLIQHDSQTVLVDAGAGKLVSTAGRIFQNLRHLGVDREDVDTVILTHLHPDHIGGLLPTDGKHPFPRARIILSDLEAAYWSNHPDLDELHAPYAIKQMIRTTADQFLQRYSGKIEAVPMNTIITPKIRLFDARGHTPGHIGVEIRLEDAVTLVAGDAFLHPAHLKHPEWTTAVDSNPEETLKTRHHILERMHDVPITLLGFHLPVTSAHTADDRP